MKRLILITCLLSGAYCQAQYAPQAGVAGSTAIAATSGQFVNWASSCTVQRGYLNIDSQALGKVTSGTDTFGTGVADDQVVSLGDSGVAVLTFPAPIINGIGADFAVFENGFANPADPAQAFLELAFVEVSTDGIRYVRFPAASNTQDTAQIAGAGTYMDARFINNLAGKYIANYGTPFDLQELADSSGIDINNINYVRLVDVIGDIGAQGTTDAAGRRINDPYPTAFPTGGFDLDAVGVIHQNSTGVKAIASEPDIVVYPNPTTDAVVISLRATQNHTFTATLTDCVGRTMAHASWRGNQYTLCVQGYSAGVYNLVINDESGRQWIEKVVKR